MINISLVLYQSHQGRRAVRPKREEKKRKEKKKRANERQKISRAMASRGAGGGRPAAIEADGVPGGEVKRRKMGAIEHTLIGGMAGVVEVTIQQPTVTIKNALQVRKKVIGGKLS